MIAAESTVQQHLLGARDPHSPQTEGPVDSLQTSQEVSTMADPDAAPVQRAIAFGPFQLLPAQRLLLEAGQPVRIVTIVGPGGVGKTTVAIAVARGLIGAYGQSVRFVDLASLLDPRLVPNALAAALGLEIRSEDPIPGLLAALRGKPMLLVLDNCEHVVEAAAALAVEVLNGAPGLQILATSREPLRMEGEHTHRLSSLESPPASARLTAAQALSFPAVQLFVERAAAASSAFTFGDEQAPLIADICRRLDGIPLAIELAAARIDAFGVHGVAGHLDQCLQLLAGGSRAALPRHQTFRATLDWGHDLLPAPERMVLRRLAAFGRGFTLEAASAVAAGAEITGPEVVECVANLVTKSLIAADVEGPLPRYRLSETTRAYALEKLSDSGELEQVKRRHTECYHNLVQRAEVCCDTPAAEWLAGIDAARAARAFSPVGDALIGSAPPVGSKPAWLAPPEFTRNVRSFPHGR
jgi:predicted ATPase